MKKKRTFGVSPKGSLILREREEQRRRNLPRVEVIRDRALKRVEENPLLKLIAEFPMLHAIDIDYVTDPGVNDALDYANLVVTGGGLTRNKRMLPWHKPFVGMPLITQPADDVDLLKKVTDHLISPLTVFDPTWGATLVNPPRDVTLNNRIMIEPCTNTDPTLVMDFEEHESTKISDWLKTWYPKGGGLPFVIKPESERPELRYKMRRANARAEVGFADNNYRDFVDVIHSWYTRDGEQQEYRLYTSEVKICADMEKLTKYFSDFKERSGVRLSGLDITLGFEVDNRFTLLVTEVFYHEQPMLLLEVVTTVPNMRSMGFVRFFKDPGTLKARNDSEHDISWTFNTFFSDFNVFGRDQLSQFLDIVTYCLDKGVREEISYYGTMG
jgi:hypothetical protein